MTSDGAMLAATTVDEQAALWLQKRKFWSWREEDQSAFDAWLAESSSHEISYWRLEAAWEATQRLSALQRPSIQRSTPRSPWPKFSAVAALAGLAIVAGIALPPYFRHSEIRTITTAIGERKTISLGDGSKIELNTNSRLKVVSNSEGRKAWLDKGEALFDIVHDGRRPFEVTIGNRRITDLGTKFLVRRSGKELSISLIEGSARFDALDGSVVSPVFLKPGDTLDDSGKKIIAIRKTASELSDELGWQRGVLVFKHATLAGAAAEFNRYNTNKIVVPDQQTARIAIGGTFQSNNVSVFAESVRDLLGLRVTRRGDNTVISR
jgi:transmembrane sensor